MEYDGNIYSLGYCMYIKLTLLVVTADAANPPTRHLSDPYHFCNNNEKLMCLRGSQQKLAMLPEH